VVDFQLFKLLWLHTVSIYAYQYLFEAFSTALIISDGRINQNQNFKWHLKTCISISMFFAANIMILTPYLSR